MKKMLLVATAFAGLPSVAIADNEGGIYATIQPSGFGVELEGGNTAGHSAIGARLGYNINKYFGVESELNYVYSSGEYDFRSSNFNYYDVSAIDMNYNAGAFVVGKIPFNKHFEIFGRAGYTTTDWGADTYSTCNGFSCQEFSLDSDRFAAGLGLQAFFGSKAQHGLRVDLTGYEGDEEMAQFSLGYSFRK
ncbi:outer membrane beta-barrel protein [Hirschia maritima]|uniref:outer membrane beta-barrel protein n=1 Tax=Hirschia maritima TaxID=1121961 RepID=UPI00036A80FF|nr:outer membrane beta-barrel protein [Hirschia maritima]